MYLVELSQFCSLNLLSHHLVAACMLVYWQLVLVEKQCMLINLPGGLVSKQYRL